jgi:hypothetical protein
MHLRVHFVFPVCVRSEVVFVELAWGPADVVDANVAFALGEYGFSSVLLVLGSTSLIAWLSTRVK